ncbi:MAG TPA: DUF1569 domain-containing protein [Terracidiphilus sp.]
MESLFDRSASEEIRQRLLSLQPDSQRLWGKMSSAQMLAHCSASLEMAMGRLRPPRLLIGSIIGRAVKSLVLREGEPMRRNAPTAKALKVAAGDGDFVKEKSRLDGLIDCFAASGPGGCTTHPHCFFGRLTPEEWSVLMYKHLDHHLRQFGA